MFRKYFVPLLVGFVLSGAVVVAQQSGGPGGTTFNGGTITTPLTITGGTVTVDTPTFTTTETNNAGGVAFHTVIINVTDTASAVGSRALSIQKSSSEVFGVRVGDGQVFMAGTTNTINGANSTLNFNVSSANIFNGFNGTNNGIGNRLDNCIAWSGNATLPSGTQGATEDTCISRLSAGTLAIGNGTQGDFTGGLKLTTLQIASGGSTTISTGVGSVKMSTANAATNASWIPITYAGTVYFVPGFTTNAP